MKHFVSPSAVAVLLLTLVLSAPAQADAPKGDTHAQDEVALRKLVANQAEAWNRHDAAAWSKDFALDADFVNIVGTVLSGKQEIQERHALIFEKLFKLSQTRVTVRHIVFPSPDVAIVDMAHEVTGYTALPPGVQATSPGVLRTLMKFVLTRTRDGDWKILAGQNTDIKPAPSALSGAVLPSPKALDAPRP